MGARGLLSRGYAGLDGEANQVGEIVDFQLMHEPVAVGLDGSVTDAEVYGDLLVSLPLGKPAQHLTLAV